MYLFLIGQKDFCLPGRLLKTEQDEQVAFCKKIHVFKKLGTSGRKKDDPDEKVGYYGEWVVLHAQMLGMNTCWVGLTYSKRKLDIRVGKDEKLVCVLALGYGADQGVAHESKPMEELCDCDGDMPEWFRNGMEAAMLAPTAMNKQKFRFTLNGDGKVSAKTAGGPYSEVDLGIAKLHCELGAGKDNFQWA